MLLFNSLCSSVYLSFREMWIARLLFENLWFFNQFFFVELCDFYMLHFSEPLIRIFFLAVVHILLPPPPQTPYFESEHSRSPAGIELPTCAVVRNRNPPPLIFFSGGFQSRLEINVKAPLFSQKIANLLNEM